MVSAAGTVGVSQVVVALGAAALNVNRCRSIRRSGLNGDSSSIDSGTVSMRVSGMSSGLVVYAMTLKTKRSCLDAMAGSMLSSE